MKQPGQDLNDQLASETVLRITRELRLSLPPRGSARFPLSREHVVNSWAGLSPGHLLAPHVALRATVTGPASAVGGYIVDVREMDQAMWKACEATYILDSVDAVIWLGRITQELKGHFRCPSQLFCVELQTTPFQSYYVLAELLDMIRITQQFEFSAAHRLHSATLSDAENAQLFGKCNNPHGHGHNYRVDISVSCPTTSDGGVTFDMSRFEAVVLENVICQYDHKHLDEECSDFQHTISTVENISAAIWRRLDGKIEGGELHTVRVYETPKTWAEVSAD